MTSNTQKIGFPTSAQDMLEKNIYQRTTKFFKNYFKLNLLG